MTLVSIMKDDENPRVKIAAARALLSRGASENAAEPLEHDLSPDDIDLAIAAAKALLDELAARKAQGLSGAGPVADGGAPAADNAEG